MRVLLLNMPWVSLSRPAIGISLLKARLREDGIACDVRYPNVLFAGRVGRDAYELVNDHLSNAFFVGDWLFSQYLFGQELDLQGYNRTLRHYLDADERYATILRLRHEVGPFLMACFDAFDIASYDIVGFTTTFEQNLASLALARHVKQRHPDKTIVFGGANCEGIMGQELHRSFPWIDFVCSGESDYSFPALVRALRDGTSTADLPGVVRRVDGESRAPAPADVVRQLDPLPDPDYDDYFAAIAATPFFQDLHPSLLIETARGCWWGAKSHCTFCGLNGATMAFRAKSAPRVIAELERQMARYGIARFAAVDNIMSFGYFKDLLPALKARRLGVSLFYEIKSNLKRDQIELLRDAGVLALQPGVESLSSHVLRLMGKGVTAIQNVQLLKLCREYGIQIAWNLLYGFPGERPEDYAETAKTIEAIYHLKAPNAVAPIRLDRFSPHFDRASSFGITNIRPFSLYHFVYPLPPERIANLAYFFEYDHGDGRCPESYLQDTLDRSKVWKEAKCADLVMHAVAGDELHVADTRPGRPPRIFPMKGIQREIYEYCDEIRPRTGILARARELGGSGEPFEHSVDAFLDQLVELQLMMREGNQYLSLAVSRDPRRAPGTNVASF